MKNWIQHLSYNQQEGLNQREIWYWHLHLDFIDCCHYTLLPGTWDVCQLERAQLSSHHTAHNTSSYVPLGLQAGTSAQEFDGLSDFGVLDGVSALFVIIMSRKSQKSIGQRKLRSSWKKCGRTISLLSRAADLNWWLMLVLFKSPKLKFLHVLSYNFFQTP